MYPTLWYEQGEMGGFHQNKAFFLQESAVWTKKPIIANCNVVQLAF